MNGGPALLAAAALAAALCATGAAAAENGAYLGAAFGQAKLTEWCDTGGSPTALTACDDTDTAAKLFGGYRFNQYVALEASLIDWGEVTASTSTVNVSAKQRSYGIAGVGTVPFGPRFDIFGKLGFVRTEQETTSPTSTVDRSETEFHYGVGGHVRLWRGLMLRGEVERTEKLKVEMVSIGVEYRF